MQVLVVPLCLTRGPAVLSTGALARTFADYRKHRVRLVPLVAVGCAWLITAYAACTFLRYTIHSSAANLPPWKDPETLDLAMLFLLAPIGLVATVIAALHGGSKWAVVLLVVGLLALSFVGLLEGASV